MNNDEIINEIIKNSLAEPTEALLDDFQKIVVAAMAGCSNVNKRLENLRGGEPLAAFEYEAMDQSGQEVKGDIDAKSVNDAVEQLRQMSYFPTKIRQKRIEKIHKSRGSWWTDVFCKFFKR